MLVPRIRPFQVCLKSTQTGDRTLGRECHEQSFLREAISYKSYECLVNVLWMHYERIMSVHYECIEGALRTHFQDAKLSNFCDPFERFGNGLGVCEEKCEIAAACCSPNRRLLKVTLNKRSSLKRSKKVICQCAIEIALQIEKLKCSNIKRVLWFVCLVASANW